MARRQNQFFAQTGRAVAGLALVALLAGTGCYASKPAPIYVPRASAQPQAETSGRHTVKAGDTLYSIAFVYGLNYQELARWNGLDKNYRIAVGQILRLTPAADGASKKQAATEKNNKKRQKNGENVNKASVKTRSDRVESSRNGSNATVIPVSATASEAPDNARTASVNARAPTLANTRSAGQKNEGNSGSAGALDWSWPSPGAVIQRYSELITGNKGLNIAGRRGEPVRAAAPGRVVYAGSGLRGFGQLIILKHTDEFLSAYAHNSKLHVREDEVVQAGQLIADIGNSGTDRDQLHFEIRHLGVPVDPLKYLPKR